MRISTTALLLVTSLPARGAQATSADDVRRIFHRDHAVRLVPLLVEAIRFPTVEGDASAFGDQKKWLGGVGRELGFEVHDAGPVTEVDLPGPPGAPVLGLVVHGDVQPVSEAEWSVPPFAGIEKDGFIWGRGSADDKGPLVQALLAMRSLRDSGLPRTHTIRLLVGSDEESSNKDMKTYLEGHRAPDLSLVLDSAFPVVVGEKAWNALTVTADPPLTVRPGPERPWEIASLEAGISTSIVPSRAVATLRWRPASLEGLREAVAGLAGEPSEGTSLQTVVDGRQVTVVAHGRAAHAGLNLERGANALLLLARSLSGKVARSGAADLLDFAAMAGADLYGTGLGLTDADPIWGRYAVNVATIKGTDGGKLALTINLRRPPPLTGPGLRARLESLVAEFNATHDAHLAPSGFFDDEPFSIDPDSEIVRRLLAAYDRVTGEDARPAISGGSTYAKRMPHAIAFGMWLPGKPYPGHDADERISVVDLLSGTDVLIEALVDLATSPRALPPAGADSQPSRLTFDSRNFIFVRLSTAHSSALYGGYSFGAWGAFAGLVRNPRNGYHEWIGGALTGIVWREQAVSIALALADASDGRYGQLYFVPSLRTGSLSLSGTVELYEPLGGSGVRQLYLDPVRLLRRMGPRWDLGVAYSLGVSAGAAPQHRIGPALQVACGGGSLRVELLHDFRRSSNDVRATYQASF
ncbi:MAG TPA: Sapep family Mn(2+)-dependent dipeptidase [Vicinamibacteria bacterium]|nr:Sapep family Mn(2+)-dependent dipeptidase [Vicinamibacteria bacterium]